MALPKRWEPYSAVGEKIEGTRFISFKVPLNEKLSSRLPEDLRFTPDNLVEIVTGRGQKLAAVIDLTNTFRYYNKQELLKHNIQHVKILVEGKRIPSRKVVNSFFTEVEKILKETESEESESLIGVHCTHGVNRSGYLICRYMVEKMSIDPDKAIEAFSAARGYSIERENFLEDLRLRRDGGEGLPESNWNDSEQSDERFRGRFNKHNFHGRNGRFVHRSRYQRSSEAGDRLYERSRYHEQERFYERQNFYEHGPFQDRERGFRSKSGPGPHNVDFTADTDYSGSWGGNWKYPKEPRRRSYSYSFSEHISPSYKRLRGHQPRYQPYERNSSFQYQNQRPSSPGNYYQFDEYSGNSHGYMSFDNSEDGKNNV